MFTDQEKALIEELNLQHLSEQQQSEQLQKFYETLHIRVGMALEDRLSEEQLREFEKISEVGDNEVTNAWLKHSITDYDQVVAEEMSALKRDVKKSAADFRAIINDE